VLPKLDDTFDKAILSQEDMQLTVEMSTGKLIPGSNREYSHKVVFSGGRLSGPRPSIPGAAANPVTLTISFHGDVSDPTYPDPVNYEIVSDRADPFAVTAI
jgi:hypothetical protein